MIEHTGNQYDKTFKSAFLDNLEAVDIDAFFYWYVEVVGKQVVSRAVRRKPSLVTQLSLPHLQSGSFPEYPNTKKSDESKPGPLPAVGSLRPRTSDGFGEKGSSPGATPLSTPS